MKYEYLNFIIDIEYSTHESSPWNFDSEKIYGNVPWIRIRTKGNSDQVIIWRCTEGLRDKLALGVHPMVAIAEDTLISEIIYGNYFN